MKAQTLFTLLLAVAVSACASGPNINASRMEVPQKWSAVQTSQAGVLSADWWRLFNDATLDALVERALERNRDLAQADASLRAARALAREARAARWPVGGVSGGTQRTRQSAASQPAMEGAPDRFADQKLTDLGAELSWELDIFGELAAAGRAAGAEVDEAQWRRRQTEAAVAAATVRAYVDLKAFSEIEKNATARSTSFSLVVERLERGAALGGVPRDQVEEAISAFESLRLALPLIQLQARNAARRISVLTGEAPQIGVASLSDWTRSPLATPPDLAITDPERALRLRPDVGMAEARLQAALARIAIAESALYPRITLSASAGDTGNSNDFSAPGAFRFAYGPQLTWGVFDLARTRARIGAANAHAQAALSAWEQTSLTALEEADSALDTLVSRRLAAGAATRAATAAARASAHARLRLEGGQGRAIDAVRADIQRLTTEAAAIDAEADVTRAWIDAHLALGGGWRDVVNPAPLR
jgi:NodT family efflux transporter outer membrane factor (OMF) lipoprotein